VSEWTGARPLGKLARYVAFGHSLAINGDRERKFFSAWTPQMDALKALSVR
jgi:hypothetical protein